MVDIKAYGKAELSVLGINFVSIPVLSIPYLDKTFYAKPLWFSSEDDIKAKTTTIDPLIIFNQTGEYTDNAVRGFADKLPSAWASPTAIFIRAISGVDINTWNRILSNVLEPESMNFTFKWDFSNYRHPAIDVYNKKQEMRKINQDAYDAKERDEYIQARTHKKISFVR